MKTETDDDNQNSWVAMVVLFNFLPDPPLPFCLTMQAMIKLSELTGERVFDYSGIELVSLKLFLSAFRMNKLAKGMNTGAVFNFGLFKTKDGRKNVCIQDFDTDRGTIHDGLNLHVLSVGLYKETSHMVRSEKDVSGCGGFRRWVVPPRQPKFVQTI